MIRIREMQTEDIVDVYDLERITFAFPFPELYISLIFFQNPDLCFALEIDVNLSNNNNSYSKIIGFILGGRSSFKSEAHILSIAIHRNFRKKGYGKMILRYFITRVKELGFNSIKLEVRVTNNYAINLYEKMGFKRIRTIRKYYEDRENAYLYRLIL
ncbi:MAG: ribosomal protein S18-alanine N-acetyltransferase [Candidatus Heimdallarchaeum endolithica]|uniref:Ribosomal protein S18-alanine N-acetyltransferase n=1 Tax=Candidatus Heimdallarchaeum endolithica TaxID=2876572 RepID=A0A9Y1BQ38_9ARCH|nr:MAG: ribosomal protein S18-alanine N-acetyltransferase [Candidatus Heimdallarchaeum endolithica]